MAIINIRQFGDHVLKQASEPVSDVGREIKKLVKNMTETMYAAEGLGLAAVQIGILQRVIVTDVSGEGEKLMALANPRIVEKQGKITEEEGCLSVRGVQIPIERAQYIKIKGLDIKTKKEETIEAEGWLARAFQHEIDHLEGKLILDRATNEDRHKILRQLTLSNRNEGE
ncbi:MAG: peptide deformylase [Actinobacteria bacterium]|nr:MAG: peptide deformylase [Actinomycetota bacterium]